MCKKQINGIKRYKYNNGGNLQKQINKESNYLYLHKQASQSLLWHNMGSLGKKALQNPIIERTEKSLGQRPWGNQGVLSAGKVPGKTVLDWIGGKINDGGNPPLLDQLCTSRRWEEGFLHSESALCADRWTDFSQAWDFILEKDDEEFHRAESLDGKTDQRPRLSLCQSQGAVERRSGSCPFYYDNWENKQFIT